MFKKILEKYKQMNTAVKMAFWFLFCSFLQKGIGFITTPIFTRVMSEEQFGRFTIFNSWSSVIAVFVTLSISGNCFTRGLVVNEDDKDGFASSLQGLVTTCIVIWAILFLCFNGVVNKLTGLTPFLLVLLFIELLFSNAYNFYYNRKRVAYDYKSIVVITLLFSFFRPVFGVIAVYLAKETFQVEARVASIVLVNLILFLPLYINTFRKGKRFFDRAYWRYALVFCIPLIPHYLSSVVLNQADRIMISRMIGDAEAAYYSVAYTLAGVLSFFNTAVAQAFDPWIYQSLKEKKLDQIAPLSYKILLGIAAINFMLVLVAPEVLHILGPSNYHQALYAVPPVTISVFFTFSYNLFATFQFYFKKTTWIAFASFLGAGLNVVLNAVFIPKYGYVAAGYTTLICYILFAVLHYAFMRKVCVLFLDGYNIYNYKILIAIGIAMIGSCLGVIFLYPFWIVRYLLIIIGTLLAVFNRKKLKDLYLRIKSVK